MTHMCSDNWSRLFSWTSLPSHILPDQLPASSPSTSHPVSAWDLTSTSFLCLMPARCLLCDGLGACPPRLPVLHPRLQSKSILVEIMRIKMIEMVHMGFRFLPPTAKADSPFRQTILYHNHVGPIRTAPQLPPTQMASGCSSGDRDPYVYIVSFPHVMLSVRVALGRSHVNQAPAHREQRQTDVSPGWRTFNINTDQKQHSPSIECQTLQYCLTNTRQLFVWTLAIAKRLVPWHVFLKLCRAVPTIRRTTTRTPCLPSLYQILIQTYTT